MSINPHKVDAILRLRDALAHAQDNIGLPQLVALLTIAAKPGLSVNELADEIGVPQQSASRHVAILAGRYSATGSDKEDIPLIIQEINSANPRKRSLFVTDDGQKLVEHLAG